MRSQKENSFKGTFIQTAGGEHLVRIPGGTFSVVKLSKQIASKV